MDKHPAKKFNYYPGIKIINMEKSEATASLRELILLKEAENNIEAKQLKEHFHLAYESFKPLNIIKSLFKETISDPDIKTQAINSAIGMATGFVAKKMVVGGSNNIINKLLGIAVEIIVAKKVTNNAEEIKSITGILVEKIMNQTKAK